MFRRFSFDGPDGDRLLSSASEVQLHIMKDGEGHIEVNWQVSGIVSPETDPDECLMYVTDDIELIQSLLDGFTRKQKGGEL